MGSDDGSEKMRRAMHGSLIDSADDFLFANTNL